jgi:hypothetical protein
MSEGPGPATGTNDDHFFSIDGHPFIDPSELLNLKHQFDEPTESSTNISTSA